MPVVAADVQKRFKLVIVDDLPQATMETAGKVHWVKCCPLCGCTHEVLGVNEEMPYTPMCQTIPALFKTQQITWQKLYPDVTKYTSMHLVQEAAK